MLKKLPTWLVIPCGTCIVGGALGALVFGVSVGGELLLAVSVLALITGVLLFLGLLLWWFATGGLKPRLTRDQQVAVDATDRAIGEAIGHVILRRMYQGSTDPKTPKIVNIVLASAVGGTIGGFAGVGLAKFAGQNDGITFWLAVALGILAGAILGSWQALLFSRGRTHASEKTVVESPGQQDQAKTIE